MFLREILALNEDLKTLIKALKLAGDRIGRDADRAITLIAKYLGKSYLVLMKPLTDFEYTMFVGRPSGKDCREGLGGTCDRGRSILEDSAFCCESVDIRAGAAIISINAKPVCAQCVDRDQDDIGLIGLALSARTEQTCRYHYGNETKVQPSFLVRPRRSPP